VWDGPVQYQDEAGEIMMLPTDLSLIQDKNLKLIVQEYANDKELFFKDFAVSFGKLLELGFAGTKM
jgi:cytochrome c peroxidase